jgi:hypothetical protein
LFRVLLMAGGQRESECEHYWDNFYHYSANLFNY